MLLGKHQLSELGSESAKIKAMGIMDKVPLHNLIFLEHKILIDMQKATSSVMIFHPPQGYTDQKSS